MDNYGLWKITRLFALKLSNEWPFATYVVISDHVSSYLYHRFFTYIYCYCKFGKKLIFILYHDITELW